MIWTKVLVKETNGWYSSCSNCWGDWMAHLTYTSSFAFSRNWPLELPIFSGHKFTYPFVIDLLSAGLVRLGLDLSNALVLPGFVLSIGLTYLIYYFAKTLSAGRRAAYFAAILFLGNGAWNPDSRWLNFITSQLLPQRGQLPGLSLSLVVYLLLWKKKPIWAGLTAGLLPLVHAHGYLVTVLAGVWFGGKFLLPALALGLAQTGLVYGFGVGKNFLAIDFFWLKQWLDLGPMLPLLLWGLITSPPRLKKFSLPFWLIFIAANLFRFQPYAWDNTKLFIHWYLIASIGAGLVLARWKLVGLVLLPLLVFPGFREINQVWQYSNNKYQFFNPAQLQAAETARNILPGQAVVLTASNHNHWLPALTGRTIVMGYPGWLWTYGIDYSSRQADVDKMYQGDGELLAQYAIDYAVIGPDEKSMWPDLNEAYFGANFPLVFDQNGYQIFQVK